MERRVPTKAEVLAYLREDRNWGRWGKDDQVGAINMVTPEKRLSAATTIKSGKAVSLRRESPKTPAPNNPTPAHHYMKKVFRSETSVFSADYYGISYHGTSTAHMDALCHVWDENGMWNGRIHDDTVTMDGAVWGPVKNGKRGLFPEGFRLEVRRFPGCPYVTRDSPFPAWEWDTIATARGVNRNPGAALGHAGAVEVVDGEVGAGAGEPFGDRSADAIAGTGDDGDLALV